MKQCQYHKIAHRYADGELSAREKAAFETHLSTCRECGARHEDILALKKVFSQQQAIKPATDIAAAILVQTDAWSAASRNDRFWETVGAASRRFLPAAALLGCLMIFLLFSSLIARDAGESAAPNDEYLNSSLDSNERDFLSDSEENARGTLYAAFASDNGYDTVDEQRK